MKYRIPIYLILFFGAVFYIANRFPESKIEILFASFFGVFMIFFCFGIAIKKQGDPRFFKKIMALFILLSILTFFFRFI